MKAVIKAVMFANGAKCPHAGMYLARADFDAYDGMGYMDFTADVRKALKFDTAGDAMAFWRTPSTVRPLRPDGQPNRPLTALTVEIAEVTR